MATACVIIQLFEGRSTFILVNGVETASFSQHDPYKNLIEYVNNLIADYTKDGFELKTFGCAARKDSEKSTWTLVRSRTDGSQE